MIYRKVNSLSSPPPHWLERDHILEVVQCLNRVLDRELILVYTLPVSSIQCSNHQILITNDFRVENGKDFYTTLDILPLYPPICIAGSKVCNTERRRSTTALRQELVERNR